MVAYSTLQNIYNEKIVHEKKCQQGITSPSPLQDISHIDNTLQTKFEETALHVIRKKMADSSLPNKGIAFKTGGKVGSSLTNKSTYACHNYSSI